MTHAIYRSISGSLSNDPSDPTSASSSSSRTPAVVPDTVNDVKSVECLDGYTFTGADSVATCGWDGKWTEVQGHCEPVRCASPPRIVHGRAVGTPTAHSRTYMSSVVFTCNRGYRLLNSTADRVTCDAQRRWAGRRPRCVKNTCGPPPYAPPHATPHATPRATTNATSAARPTLVYLRRRSYRIGQRVTYDCDAGFRRGGVVSVNRTCLDELTWSAPDSACEVVRCARPATPANGFVLAPWLVYESTAHFTCNGGYDFVGGGRGEVVRHCNAEGAWSDERGVPTSAPRCLSKVCATPPAISDADVVRGTASIYHFGDTVTYACVGGFTASGSGATLRCSEERTWRAVEADARFRCARNKCSPPATSPENPLHGDVIVTDLRNGSQSATLHCHVGFVRASSRRPPLCVDEKWTGVLEACRRRACLALPVLAHAEPVEEEPGKNRLTVAYLYEARVLYACQTGYRSAGELMAECDADGRWAWLGGNGACLAGECPLPPFVPHARVMADTEALNSLGSRVAFACARGFELRPRDSGKLVCGDHLTWVGVVPTCAPTYCPATAADPRVARAAATPAPLRASGSRVAQRACVVGYAYYGNAWAVCEGEPLRWRWYGTGSCSPRLCLDAPPDVRNARVVTAGADVSYGEKMSYVCDVGYRDSIASPYLNTTCSVSAADSDLVVWSAVSGACVPVQCSRPQFPTNGFVTYSNHSLVKFSRMDLRFKL